MEHRVSVEYSGGRPSETLSSSLVGFGHQPDGGASAMSRSVGLTAAAGVRMLLAPPTEGSRPLTGVLRPTSPSVYNYCLPILGEEGLVFHESVERL